MLIRVPVTLYNNKSDEVFYAYDLDLQYACASG